MELEATKEQLIRYGNIIYESFENDVKKPILHLKEIIYRNYILKEPVLQEEFAFKFEEFKIIGDEFILRCEKWFKFILDSAILEKKSYENPEKVPFKEMRDCLESMSNSLIHIAYNVDKKKRKEFEQLTHHIENLRHSIINFEDELYNISEQHKEYTETIKKYIKK
jgi:hypothetical protein